MFPGASCLSVRFWVAEAIGIPSMASRSSTRRVSSSLTDRALRTDSEDRAGLDVEPAGERADQILEPDRDAGGHQPEDQSELSGERSPQDSQSDQGHRSDHVVDGLSGVVLAGAIVDPSRPDPPDDRFQTGQRTKS
jgi:hypothetical protein